MVVMGVEVSKDTFFLLFLDGGGVGKGISAAASGSGVGKIISAAATGGSLSFFFLFFFELLLLSFKMEEMSKSRFLSMSG